MVISAEEEVVHSFIVLSGWKKRKYPSKPRKKVASSVTFHGGRRKKKPEVHGAWKKIFLVKH